MQFAFLPENLDLEACLKQYHPSFKYHSDDFRFLLSTLLEIKARDKDRYDEPLTPLNAQRLQRKLRNYKSCLAYLVKHGVIITDNQYTVGEKSKAFGFTNEYINSEFELQPITKKVLLNRDKHEYSYEKRLRKDYNYLVKWLNPKLQIDYHGALNCLRELLETDKQNFQEETKLFAQQGKIRSQPMERYNMRKYSLELFAKGIFNPKVDTTVKRFHSTLTSLKSELRNYITYDGQTLCSVDVNNSQPFISTALFDPEFYKLQKGKINLHSLSPTIYNSILPNIPAILALLPIDSPPIMLVKNDLMQCQSDLERYCTLVDKGWIYEFLSDQYEQKTGEKLDVKVPAEKKKLKQAVFTTLFSDNRFFGQPEAEMKRFFAELFPTVYKVFSLIKKGGKNENLPIILQLIESEVMIRGVAKCISKEDKAMPIFTIHDSIVSPQEHGGMIAGTIKMKFMEAIGLRPNFSVEIWTK